MTQTSCSRHSHCRKLKVLIVFIGTHGIINPLLASSILNPEVRNLLPSSGATHMIACSAHHRCAVPRIRIIGFAILLEKTAQKMKYPGLLSRRHVIRDKRNCQILFDNAPYSISRPPGESYPNSGLWENSIQHGPKPCQQLHSQRFCGRLR